MTTTSQSAQEQVAAHTSSAWRCGWHGSIAQLLGAGRATWVGSLERHHRARFHQEPSDSQLRAWADAWRALRPGLADLADDIEGAGAWSLVFEYELPREGGRRPDVVLLAPSAIIVVEMKQTDRCREADRDQLTGYVRDIQAYHSAAHNVPVRGVLLLTGVEGMLVEDEGVLIASPNTLADALALQGRAEGSARAVSPPVPTLDAWLAGEYAPLPSLVHAARLLFAGDPLPAIKRAASAGVNDAVAALRKIAATAEANGERHLAVVAGVPGAGKTLVGLQFVYGHKGETSAGTAEAVLLSGNGPLIRVLSHALRSEVFVQSVHDYLREHAPEGAALPRERVWVYDEAQRAWDAAAVARLRGRAVSEPEDFVALGARQAGWAVLVVLIGDGQEIHVGEEAGLAGWQQALGASPASWVVHCPPRAAAGFRAAIGTHGAVREAEALDLTASMRTHTAEDVQRWVGAVLDGDLERAGRLAREMSAQGFRLYATRTVADAAAYARARYQEAPNARYGLLASSAARGLDRHGVPRLMSARFFDPRWFNAPADDPRSCCALREAGTEFTCQGLELDAPIVVWGSDLSWVDGQWRPVFGTRSRRAREARDPAQLLVNSYRVLLSRGRDCLLVVVPPLESLDATYSALLACGMRSLDETAKTNHTLRAEPAMGSVDLLGREVPDAT